MARARNIKPGFFANENLAECSPWARLCFIGLWTLADREGRLEDRPKRIKGELFRFDNVDVDPLLDELASMKFIRRYDRFGVKVIQVVEFVKHQKPHYSEVDSLLPGEFPDKLTDDESKTPELLSHEDGTTPEKSGDDDALRGGCNALNEDLLNPDFLKDEEDSGTTLRIVPPAPPPRFTGKNAEALNGRSVVCIAPEFELPEAWGFDAEALGFKPKDVLREAEKFRQYWTVGKGKDTRRNVKGWRQSWSNWLGKAAERMQR
jgi:hypothetical protein